MNNKARQCPLHVTKRDFIILFFKQSLSQKCLHGARIAKKRRYQEQVFKCQCARTLGCHIWLFDLNINRIIFYFIKYSFYVF